MGKLKEYLYKKMADADLTEAQEEEVLDILMLQQHLESDSLDEAIDKAINKVKHDHVASKAMDISKSFTSFLFLFGGIFCIYAAWVNFKCSIPLFICMIVLSIVNFTCFALTSSFLGGRHV